MIVITKNAEEKLLQGLSDHEPSSTAQRCFYLSLSRSDLPKMNIFESFLNLLQDMPDSYLAQIYICHDHDVFILMNGFMQRQFSQLVETLAEALQNPELTKLVSIMDLSRDRQKLERMCHLKIEAIDKDQQTFAEEKRKTAVAEATQSIFENMGADQLVSIAQRRDARTDVVAMVVDDDQISRTLMSNVISKTYRYIYARDGREALNTYVENAPDVLFLDIGLPDINGHEVLESLFQIDPEAYIIMFSGRKDKDTMMKSLELGAQGFVGKPFTRDKVSHYIRQSPYVQQKTGSGGAHERAAG